MSRRVVVVGGGPTAVSAFVHLLDVAETAGIRSLRFVAPNPVGCAPAFGADDPGLLCNTSLDVTSLRADGESDLLRYLAARGQPVDRADFVPRALVNQYARERYLQHREAAERRGISVSRTADRARAVHGVAGEYRVILERSGPVPATDVLLCHGSATPQLPPEVLEHADAPRLLHSPYPARRLRRIPAGATVLVLGTRLSAIDAALVLCDSGHRTLMTSPSGELPAVRTRLCRTTASGLAAEWAEVLRRGGAEPELARPLLRRIREVGGGRPVWRGLSRPTAAGDRLRRDLELAEADAVPWQDTVAEVIDALNEVLPACPEPVRQRVSAAHRPVMSRYMSAIPAENARRLLGHLDTDQLAVAPAYPRSLCPRSAGGWTVTWPDGRAEHVDWVVAATGVRAPSLSVAPTGDLLLGGGSGASAGRPAEVGPDLRVVRGRTGPPERLWALGGTAGARFPVVNYLRAAAQHAYSVSRSLAGEPLRKPLGCTPHRAVMAGATSATTTAPTVRLAGGTAT